MPVLSFPYLNVHTHHFPVDGELAIINAHEKFDSLMRGHWYSAGLHPWYLQADSWQGQFAECARACLTEQVTAVGECGLDKACGTPWSLQEEVFTAHIELANQLHKSLIIHCVRAYAEVQEMLAATSNKVPVVFHGFNKSLELALQLVHKGFFLSFGPILQTPRMQSVFTALPLTKLFLESDENTLPIQKLYEWAAVSRQIPKDLLGLQLRQNFINVFGTAPFSV